MDPDSTPQPRRLKKSKSASLLGHGTSIEVAGQRLKTTAVFDTLWEWLSERKSVDDRRRAGRSAPWTEDQILQKYKFCNAYRVLDRTSQFVVTDVIEKGSPDRTETLFRILLFNCFNKIETWQLLLAAFGGRLVWTEFDLHKYDAVLSAAETKLFTGAYMKIGVQIEYKANHMRHLQLLQILMDELPKSLANACYAADVYETIAAYPGMAAFSAYQLFLALSYSKLLDFSANDFVVAGPGALSGLTKMFGSSLKRARGQVPDIESDILRWMVENQREQFRLRGLQFSFLRDPSGDEHELDVADFEHAVCEVDKYARKAHPMIKGIGSRTELRALFSPSSVGLPPVPVLPEAWGSKRRQQWRPREAAVSVEKRYIVDEILQVRPSKNKRGHGTAFEYLVSWWGYSERTWEPESSLQEDVPNLLADYKRSRGI